MIKKGVPIAVITVDQLKLDSGMKPDDLAMKMADLKPDLGQ